MNNRISLPGVMIAIFACVLLTTLYAAQPLTADQPDYVFTDSHVEKTEEESTAIPKDSVLNLIPEDVLGIIYCPSLSELNKRINGGAAELMPQADQQTKPLASLLANAFGAGFESLAELEQIGLDLAKDFAILFTSFDPIAVAATAHLTDPDAMMQVIETEVEGSEPTEYNGETYLSSNAEDGSFAILGNTLVFSQQAKDCMNIIDVSKGDQNAISANNAYTEFLNQIAKGTDQVAAYFDLETIIAPHIETIVGDMNSAVDAMESDPAFRLLVQMIESMFGTFAELIGNLESVSATLQIQGTDIQLAPFLKFKDEGKIQDTLKGLIPDELVLMNDLPNATFMFGGFERNTLDLYKWSMSLLLAFSSEDEEQNHDLKKLVQEMQEMYKSLGNEQGFSVNFRDTLIPDVLVICDLKDEEKVKTYYDEHLLDNLIRMMQIMKETKGENPQFTIYDGGYVGNSIMHNGVEIKTIVFPNFGTAFQDVPVGVAALMPHEWHWSYAFSDGRLYFALGGAEIIQTALNSKTKVVESISENVGYQNLVEKLGKDNNLIFGISPVAVVKSIASLVSKADPDAADMQMMVDMLMGIPENYNTGISAKVRDGGVGAKLFISLSDYKQLVQTFMMMMNPMGQMQ